MSYKRTGRPAGRPRISYDLEKVEQLAGRQLSIREIAYNLNINPATLEDHYLDYPKVKTAIDRGRARSTAFASSIVMAAMQPKKKAPPVAKGKKKAEVEEPTAPEITSQNIRAAENYLQRFGDLWKNPSNLIAHNTTVNGDVNVSSAPELPEEVKMRAAKAFLQLKGCTVEDPPLPENVTPIKKTG